MNAAIHTILDDAEWDKLIDRANAATVYHGSAWIGALAETVGARFHRVSLEADETLLAVWPIGLLRKGPLRIGGSPLPGWNTAYFGPLFTEACEDKAGAVRLMFEAAPIRKPAFLATRVMDTTVDLEPLGFRRIKDFETYEIDLTEPAETLWDNLKGTCRTQIRKGEKNGLEIREEHDNSYLDDFMIMAGDVFAKTNKKPPFSREFLEHVDSRLRRQGQLLVTSAFHGAKRIATLMIPHNRYVAMYFAGVSLSCHLNMAPNNLLHWKTMLLCKELGLARYDFISSRGSPGRFKATFRPVEKTGCVHWEHSSHSIVRVLRDAYENKSRKLRRTTPCRHRTQQ